jgi:hypothetical protein
MLRGKWLGDVMERRRTKEAMKVVDVWLAGKQVTARSSLEMAPTAYESGAKTNVELPQLTEGHKHRHDNELRFVTVSPWSQTSYLLLRLSTTIIPQCQCSSHLNSSKLHLLDIITNLMAAWIILTSCLMTTLY